MPSVRMRTIIEEHRFVFELQALIPKAKRAGLRVLLSTMAKSLVLSVYPLPKIKFLQFEAAHHGRSRLSGFLGLIPNSYECKDSYYYQGPIGPYGCVPF